MKKQIQFSAILMVLSFGHISAQDEENDSHKMTLSSYVDGYFSGYNTDLGQEKFQPFITVGARDNYFGVNIAQIGLSYEDKDIRGNVILHYGDIPQATWSSDFNVIQQANVGVRIMDGLWLDAGFFSTHIGTESFLQKTNF